MRRDGVSITVAESDLPKSMRPLISDLNKMIDGELGHIVADDRHFSASGVTGSDASDDDASAPTDYENSPATPVSGGQGPEPELSLSCYGSGGRQSEESESGITAGPLTLEGLSGKRVIEARAIVEPGSAVTIAVDGRAGLLYGVAGRARARSRRPPRSSASRAARTRRRAAARPASRAASCAAGTSA